MAEDDTRFVEIFAQLHAVQLMVNEVFSAVLARDPDTANAVVTARRHIAETAERGGAAAIAAGSNPEWRNYYVRKVQDAIRIQMDAIEVRVSQLRRGQTTH